MPPIIVSGKYYLVNIYRNGLYFLAPVATEVSGEEGSGVLRGQGAAGDES